MKLKPVTKKSTVNYPSDKSFAKTIGKLSLCLALGGSTLVMAKKLPSARPLKPSNQAFQDRIKQRTDKALKSTREAIKAQSKLFESNDKNIRNKAINTLISLGQMHPSDSWSYLKQQEILKAMKKLGSAKNKMVQACAKQVIATLKKNPNRPKGNNGHRRMPGKIAQPRR